MTRHINGFRPLRQDERWHIPEWFKEPLGPGERPLLVGESMSVELWNKWDGDDDWSHFPADDDEFVVDEECQGFYKTREPLP